MGKYKKIFFIFFYWYPIGPTGDTNGTKIDFLHLRQISQNQFSNFFLFRAYSFHRMSSISYKELDPIESLEGGPPDLDSDFWDRLTSMKFTYHFDK